MRTVRDLMTQEPVSVGRRAPLSDIYDLMTDRGFRHMPVVDDEDELVGLVSHRDLAAAMGERFRLPGTEQQLALEEKFAEDVMTRGIETVSPDHDLRAAAELMLEHKFGCLPVCEGAHLVGILTEADFVRLAVEG